jgi:gamma-glutamyltranspeptidase/glutathione hydrolase
MRYTIIGLLVCVILPASLAAVNTDGVFQHGAVVCSEKHAAEVGATVLESDGNAVDAACASALAMAVTYPQAGNIGGGGFALVYLVDSQKVFFLDFRETAPANAEARYFLDAAGNVDRDKATAGPLTAGTPGTVAGLCEMHSRFGKTAWPELVRPAHLLADSGFAISERLTQDIALHDSLLRRFPATAAVLFADGRPLEPGRLLKQPDLAKALGLIEKQGRDGFYRGELAEAVAGYCAQNGGLITTDDLEKYQPVWRDPIHVRFRELDIFMPGLPSSGGIVLGQILGMMDRFRFERYAPDSPEYIHLFTEAARRAYADRAAYLGDRLYHKKGKLD